MSDIGNEMHNLCSKLFPICRSITGNGVRETLSILRQILPELKIHEIPSGTKVFDWIVPREWNIKDAYIIDPQGNKIVDFQKSNLHIISYSIPIDKVVTLEELQEHLYSLPDQPDAIPYITSYYSERWGFCITEVQRKQLKSGNYHVVIQSELSNGHLSYGEIIIPGKDPKEIFLSANICHPSLANNELSGPVVTTFLAKWLLQLKERKYSYRIVFIPETIGSITYTYLNLEVMKKRIIAGFHLTCIGDDRSYSFIPSRYGNTIADQIALHVLKYSHPDFIQYSFLDRGSDERQYCCPGVDLPIVSIMRSKYAVYPEYHTSLDDLKLVTPAGLKGGYDVIIKCIDCLEKNEKLKVNVLCEPQLGKRGLYPTMNTKKSAEIVRDMMNLIVYCDGKNSLVDICEIIKVPMWTVFEIVERLKQENLLTLVDLNE